MMKLRAWLFAATSAGVLCCAWAHAEQLQRFGDWEVHYVVLPSGFLKPDVAARIAVISRIAEFAGVSPDCVYLFKSGMAGIFALYRALMKMEPDGTCIQYGFSYVDTLKIHQGFG